MTERPEELIEALWEANFEMSAFHPFLT